MGTTDKEGVRYHIEFRCNGVWGPSSVNGSGFDTRAAAWEAVDSYILQCNEWNMSLLRMDYRVVEVREGAAPPPSPSADFKISTAEKKVPLNLIPLRALKGSARVFQYGVKKYAKGNFLKAMVADGAFERYVGGLLRHLAATQGLDGIYSDDIAAVDEESGLPEIDHMICGLIMLRGILTKEGVLAEDPGEGNTP